MNTPHVVFADTSFYTALLIDRDAYHGRAIAWRREIHQVKVRIITTEAVLWEVLNTFAAPPYRAMVLAIYQALRKRADVTIIGFEPTLIEQAIQLYAGRLDKSWGVVDCYSFVAMKQHRVNSALTADHHFEQAGFEALLLREPGA